MQNMSLLGRTANMSKSYLDGEGRELEWRKKVTKMRERLKSRLDENTIDGKRDDNLFHGMKLVSSTTMFGNFTEICYCEETQEYLVIDPPSNMLRFSVQAKLIQPSYPLSGTMLFTKLLWCQKAKVLIGYVPNDDMIWLMTSFCMLYQVIRNEFRITDIFYEPMTNEIVVAGPNKVTKFPLANKESTMNPWKTMAYIDSEYGTLWKLECMSLIPASTSMTRLAGSYMTTIYVLPLEPLKEKEDIVPVMFLARNPAATEAAITALLFQDTSQWIITGDEQGNVMGWDLELHCTMSCPGGHKGYVEKIVVHPSICGFITCGEDNVLQIWSCNLRGKMESFSDIGEIQGIAINKSAAAIATLGQKLSCFNMHQLYTFYAALSEFATEIITTMNPMYSTRVIVRSADNTIRILSSQTGKQINLQILPKTLNLVSMAYSGNRERLYTIILKTGEVLVSNTQMNPMEFKHVWVSDRDVITCITAYEYYEEIRGYDCQPQNPRVIYPKYTLIFVGTQNGAIINVDEPSGKHEGTFVAHNGPVAKIWSSTISRLVVSVGVDKSVKVWRVFPDLEVPLALAHSVYYTVPITHVVSMGSVICMASSSPLTPMHQLFMYDMVESVRVDHHSRKDHTDLIVDIAASESLQICATSSMDNTIRLWDHQNIPIKVLEINTCANSIAFSSQRGDIVFGAGRHLYRISYCHYLSPKYRARILMNGIPEENEEEMIPENKDYRVYESIVDREFLLHPVSSAPLGSLDISDGDAPRLELMIQGQMCAQIRRRDQDIISIEKGEIKAVKLVIGKSLMNQEAWEKYLDDILGRSNKTSTEVPPYDVWAMVEKYKTVKRYYNKPGIFKMFYGYSIEKFPEYPEAVPDEVQHPHLRLFGFLPNSVIYKLFDIEDVEPPPPVPEPQPLLKYEYPPEFLLDQLRETDSSRLDSNVEMTPSQLINLTNVNDIDSDTTVLRVSIPGDQNPFVKAAQSVSRYRYNSKMKRCRTRRAYHDHVDKKKTCVKKTLKRKNKPRGSGIPLTIEKIINEDQKKLEMILSQKITNEPHVDNFCKVFSSFNLTRTDISAITFECGKVIATSPESILSTCENICGVKKKHLIVHKRTKFKKALPSKKKKKKENCRETVREEFSNIDCLARLGIKEIVLQLESIKQTIKNNYGSISTLHDNKIKDTLMVLLARFVNSPSSFSVILNLLNVIPVNNIDIIGFLCTIFIITSRRIIRKSVLKYLKNHGLRDPQKVLAKQLLMVKKVTDTTNLFEVKKFVSRMISDWIYTLERHVALIANDIKCSDNFEHVRSAVKKEGNPLAAERLKKGRNLDAIDFKDNKCAKEIDQMYEKWCHTDMHDGCVTWKDLNKEIVVSPIEGINYFCEMNIEFSNTPKDPQQSSQHTCGRHSKCKASQQVRSTYTK